MARDGEIIGRYMKPGIGAMREFANLESDKNRVIFMLLSIQTFPDEPITASPHQWPSTYALLDYTPEDCGVAQADWVRVGMAFWGDEGLTLHPMMFDRAKVRRATGKWIDDDIRQQIYERDGYCRYCGSTESLSLDHVIPRSRGGSDAPENLVTACRSCNSRKGAKTPDEAGMPVIAPGLRRGALVATETGGKQGPDGWEPGYRMVLTETGWRRGRPFHEPEGTN